MKKIALIVLTALLACSFAGCVASTTASTATTDGNTDRARTAHLIRPPARRRIFRASCPGPSLRDDGRLLRSTTKRSRRSPPKASSAPSDRARDHHRDRRRDHRLLPRHRHRILRPHRAEEDDLYALGDSLSLRGGSIAIYDALGVLLETVALTAQMVTGLGSRSCGRTGRRDLLPGTFPRLSRLRPLRQAGGLPLRRLHRPDRCSRNRRKDRVRPHEGRPRSARRRARKRLRLSGNRHLRLCHRPLRGRQTVSAFWYQEFREVSLGTSREPQQQPRGHRHDPPRGRRDHPRLRRRRTIRNTASAIFPANPARFPRSSTSRSTAP
ncbi:MAG: hypothetical protein MZW92_02790 [Comamonadaceae bacterium]|nr:hypothetical protein [Comamonadaceae bacterium]